MLDFLRGWADGKFKVTRLEKQTRIETAKKMGQEAFEKGILCIPFLDMEFMKIVDQSKDSISEMKAWIFGWTTSNLNALE